MQQGKKVVVGAILTIALISAVVFALSGGSGVSFAVSKNGGDVEQPMLPFSVQSCNSDGMDFCYHDAVFTEKTYSYAQIEFTDLKQNVKMGTIQGEDARYIVGKASVDVEYMGDKLYVYNGLQSWSDVDCDRSGCNGNRLSNEYENGAEYVIADAPAKLNNKHPAFAVHDYNEKEGEWSYVWVGGGFVKQDYNPDYWDTYVVNCYSDSDCSSGEICDTSGTWDTWTCRANPCSDVATPDKCEGYDLYSQKCVLENGNANVVKDELIESDSTECGWQPPEDDTGDQDQNQDNQDETDTGDQEQDNTNNPDNIQDDTTIWSIVGSVMFLIGSISVVLLVISRRR